MSSGSGSGYSYDDQGQFFPFFILTLTGLVTIPLTWTLVAPSKEADALAPRIKSQFRPEHDDVLDKLRAAQKKRSRKTKRMIFVFVGWALMALMVYLIVVTQRTVPKIWNPYDILGISDSADEKAIKRHYKKLSLKYHPDKVRPDPAKNETLESLNDHYVELTKAYQALTDEEVRNNYIQYGHPDGKQSFSIGIALPQFLIADGNGKYVILVYALLLGVLLPYMVGSWWYGTQRTSKEGVLMESANNLFLEYDDGMDEGSVVAALSTAREYVDLLKGEKAESALAKIESRLSAAGILSPKDLERLEDVEEPARRKALALLWAYLGRVELDDLAETALQGEVGLIGAALTRSMTAIALAYGNTAPILASFAVSQHLVQALPPKASPLLQLPHFTSAIAQAVEGGDAKTHMTVQRFMDLPDVQRRSLAVGKDLLSESQYQTAVSVAKQLPYLRVAKAFFKVTGERYITPSSLVSLVVKGRFVPPGSEDVPAIDPLDLEDVDPAEDDIDALMGRKKAVKSADGTPAPVTDDKPVLPPLAFAPRFAKDQAPKWSVFLTDSKQGKMAVPPFTFTQFDRPIYEADGVTPTYNMQTLKAQFAAPGDAGAYTFVMHVVCDSYVGFDTRMEVTLHVEDASKAADMQKEDEISEPEEDSLAGTMNALKSGNLTGPPPKPRRRKVEEEESDDESNTEEEDDDTSATNTDTEDES